VFTLEIRGGRQIEAALADLELKVAKKIVRTAVRLGAKPILAQAQANAVGMVGGNMGTAIRKALTVRAQQRQRPGSYGVNILIRPSEAQQFKYTSKTGHESYIPYAIEYGHVGPGQGGEKGAPLVARPIPFTRAAFDAKAPESARVIEQQMWNGIEKAAREAPKVA